MSETLKTELKVINTSEFFFACECVCEMEIWPPFFASIGVSGRDSQMFFGNMRIVLTSMQIELIHLCKKNLKTKNQVKLYISCLKVLHQCSCGDFLRHMVLFESDHFFMYMSVMMI